MRWEIKKEDINLLDDEIEIRLAHLLLNGVIYCNNGWWNKNWPKDHITLHVNCNDVFAWGWADGEEIKFSEISELYNMWVKDEIYGHKVWCIRKRGVMPQKPVEESIRIKGIWDLDSMNLEKNGE